MILKLCYIDGFDQNYNTITHLCVEKASMAKLKEYDLRTMVQNFKKLEKCYFYVTLNLGNLTTVGLKNWQMERHFKKALKSSLFSKQKDIIDLGS